jgi:hypothetical protein
LALDVGAIHSLWQFAEMSRAATTRTLKVEADHESFHSCCRAHGVQHQPTAGMTEVPVDVVSTSSDNEVAALGTKLPPLANPRFNRVMHETGH